MFKQSENNLKDLAGLLVAAYMVGVMLYGMWSMMQHIHWVVPFFLVGLAVVTQNNLLVTLNVLAAAGMAAYGMSLALHVHWFKAGLYLLAPLVLVALLTGIVRKFARKPDGQP